MKYYFSLQIDVEEEKCLQVNQILGTSNNMPNLNWSLEILIDENNTPFD